MITTGSFKNIYAHTYTYYFIYHVLKEIHVLFEVVAIKFILCMIIKLCIVYFFNKKSNTFLMLKNFKNTESTKKHNSFSLKSEQANRKH